MTYDGSAHPEMQLTLMNFRSSLFLDHWVSFHS